MGLRALLRFERWQSANKGLQLGSVKGPFMVWRLHKYQRSLPHTNHVAP